MHACTGLQEHGQVPSVVYALLSGLCLLKGVQGPRNKTDHD